MATNPLAGTWRLKSFHYQTSDGRVVYPYGRDVAGYIVYTDDGHVSVIIESVDRPRQADVGEDYRGGTVQEKASAYDGYLSYAGTYETDGRQVVHHVEVCLFPNWIGTDLVRYPEIKGRTLTLRTVPFTLDGVEQTSYLVWERT